MKKIFLILITSFLVMSAQGNTLEEIFGNSETGDSCQSDYQCQSLCCNDSTGTCNRHEPQSAEPILCNKALGQSCITSEFCKSEYIVDCKIIKIYPARSDGSQNCALRCLAILKNSPCVNKRCQPPYKSPVPSFNPANPDCSNAVDP